MAGSIDPWASGPDRLREVLDGVHEAFISMDAGGVITDWNPAAERTFGFSREEAVGRVLADTIIPESYRPAHWRGLRHFLEAGVGPVLGQRLELSAVHREGHEFPVELTISAASEAGEPSFHALLHDISERKRAERLLVAQNAVTTVLARAAEPSEAIEALLPALGESMEWQLGSYWAVDERAQELRVLATWCAPSFAADEFVAQTMELRFAVGDGLPGRAWASAEPVWIDDVGADSSLPRARAARAAGLTAAICVPIARAGGVIGVIEFLSSQRRSIDRSIGELLAGFGDQIGQLLGALEERLELLVRLERLALTDELTGLPNRRAWEDGLRRELARAARERNRVCVGLIDLDEFKRFNDERGHHSGDELLAEAATVWQTKLRPSDLLARLGGDEFGLLFPAWSLEAAVAVVQRLRTATPSGHRSSAGVTCWDGSELPAELVKRADAALYKAKRDGRDRTVAAPPEGQRH